MVVIFHSDPCCNTGAVEGILVACFDFSLNNVYVKLDE